MNKLEIIRKNGGVVKALPGEDHISGLIAYLPADAIPDAFKSEAVHPISTIERAEALGIVTNSHWHLALLHYHIGEALRVGSGMSLYVGVFAKPSALTFAEVATVQRYADGRIRQMGVWMGDVALTTDLLTKAQAAADKLDGENAPLSLILCPKVAEVGKLPVNLASSGNARVSVVIGQDGGGDGLSLYTHASNATAKATVGIVGLVLGITARAKVHQAISWVKMFPTGLSLAAYGDGTLVRSVDKARIEALDTARYIQLATYSGVAGIYLSDSHTMDDATSDYAQMEAVRTMDKAVRGIRTYLTPELGGNVYVDKNTGKLQPYTVTHLEMAASRILEQMERAGELSGYKPFIDPDQDVLRTSSIEVALSPVQVGVVRHFRVKIGYVTKV